MITSKKLFRILHGSGDAGSEVEYHAQNPSLIEGWERLAKMFNTTEHKLHQLKCRNLINAVSRICQECGHTNTEDGCAYCMGKSMETLKESTQWRPIETAPRDGTWVDLHNGLLRRPESYWSQTHGGWVWKNRVWPSYEPTYWMPLPKPPQEDGR